MYGRHHHLPVPIFSYYGKRSAEAESEAEADPQFYYYRPYGYYG